jgi:hypothetical protein
MAHLDERAVAGLLAGEGDHAGRHGDDVRTAGAREIDALVERLVAREGILALPEIGGDVAVSDGAAIRANLLIELLGQQRVLQRRELGIAR